MFSGRIFIGLGGGYYRQCFIYLNQYLPCYSTCELCCPLLVLLGLALQTGRTLTSSVQEISVIRSKTSRVPVPGVSCSSHNNTLSILLLLWLNLGFKRGDLLMYWAKLTCCVSTSKQNAAPKCKTLNHMAQSRIHTPHINTGLIAYYLACRSSSES